MLLLVLAMADTISGTSRSAMPIASMASTVAPTPQTPATVPSATAQSAAAQPVPSIVPETGLATPASPALPIASPDTTQSGYATEPRDPWVKANRAIFSFDTALERKLLAPVSHGYVYVVPKVVRFHLTSALFNLEEPLTGVNDLLQLRIGALGKTVFRFVVNSTFGIAGLFDVAKTRGVPIHFSLFGQTLGRYGIKPGPYVMLPILGPSDVRDAVGRLVDGLIDPVTLLVGGITSPEGLSLFVLEGVDWRARSDDTLKAVYSATDPYAFVRSAYTQSRAAAIAEATGKQVALPDFDASPGTP